jgi:hypothetical protein
VAGAALTPRVRIMAVCDKARKSKTESAVFDLRGVRQEITAGLFPYRSRLWLFLVLTSQRAGAYPAYVIVVNDKTDKTVFYAQLSPDPNFQENTEFLAGSTRIRCNFPEAGRYTIQVWFFQEQGSDVVKGQLSFRVAEGA